MKRDGVVIFGLVLLLLAGLTGCTPIQPDSSDNGTYSTQNPMSATEYSIYINKQITVFTNQLTTRRTMAHNLQESEYDSEAYMTKQSIEVMKNALEEVKVTMPASGREDDREALIVAMETAISHMKAYLECVETGESTSGFIKDFENDFNQLTGLANLYYE